MLGVRNYGQDYIDACRARIATDLQRYQELVEVATRGDDGDASVESAITAFESRYFNAMVLVLDSCFVHRLRTVEGKNGNPLNEVRVLCNSMLQNGNIMTADSSIKLVPSATVTKIQFGDEIGLSCALFSALSEAFLAEIENKFL